MHTQCPRCQTVFNVSQQQLEAASGIVCCGQCQQIFKATHYTSEAQPHHPDLFENILNVQDPNFAQPPAASAENPATLKMLLLGKNTPQPPSRRGLKILGWTANTILITLLVTSIAYIKRDTLANNPSLRPYIEYTCQHIPSCKLTTRRDLSKIELVSRNIYTHPNIKNALMISAVLSNNANYIQPYPVLLITMSNVHGKIIAQRYFQPGEYLTHHALIETDMPMDTPVAINLEIMDPGNDALAFELDFL